MTVFLLGASADVRSPCDRECDGTARECVYNFEVELYQTLSRACHDCPQNVNDCYRKHCISGDGVERGLIVVNRQMPGEPVIVCHGDTVVVRVKNKLHTETTSVHFHGEHFKGASTYDDLAANREGYPKIRHDKGGCDDFILYFANMGH